MLLGDSINPVSDISSLDDGFLFLGAYFGKKNYFQPFSLTLGVIWCKMLLMPYSFGDENEEEGGIDHYYYMNIMVIKSIEIITYNNILYCYTLIPSKTQKVLKNIEFQKNYFPYFLFNYFQNKMRQNKPM